MGLRNLLFCRHIQNLICIPNRSYVTYVGNKLPKSISKIPVSVNALKNVEIFDNVQYEPIALMEGVEDINASKTETALLLVEK